MFLKSKVKRQKAKAITVLTLMMVVLAGCRGKTDVAVPSVVPMRVVTDDLGREITVPVNITRVVSLAPSVTENIFAVGAGDRLVGVTTFCNYPEEAKAIAKVGDTMTPNIETIIALKPDVVFVSTASQIETFMKTLEANGIVVYVTNPTYLQGIYYDLDQLGIIFGTAEKTQKVVEELQNRQLRTAGPYSRGNDEPDAEYEKRALKIFVQISKEPLFTIGKEAFLNQLLEIAGGRSVTANVQSAYPKLSKETASALNPEVIILSESDDNKEPNDAFKNSPAVKNGRIYKVNADLLSRPGPRLVDALEQIAKDLHPEKFN